MTKRAIIAWLGAAALLAVSAAARDAPTPPRNALLVFVAGWCAPCRAELAELPALTAAALPARLIVVGFDRRADTRRMMARVPDAQRLDMSSEDATHLLRALAGSAPGLPVAIATDARGRACGVWRRGLTPARAAQMIADCRR